MPERCPQSLRYTLHVALAKAGIERQSQRPRRHVLAHRELPFAVAEALAVEAHQVDRRQIWLALDPRLRESADDLGALYPAWQLNHEHEPASAVTPKVLTGQTKVLDLRQRFAI